MYREGVMFQRIKSYFLSSYDSEREYVLARKAQFIFWFIVIFLPLLLLLPIVSFFSIGQDALKTAMLTGPEALSMIFALYFLKTKKVRTASNIIALFAFAIIIIGFFLRPAPVAGLSLSFYQMTLMVFAMFFCSYYFSIFLYVAILLSDIAYYFFVALPVVKTASPMLHNIAVIQLIDTPAALTIIFFIGFFSTKFTNNALSLTLEQTQKTKVQAEKNIQLLETIKTVSDKVSSSIKTTSVVITNFSDNAHTQSASVEELSATMEEISAGTTSTTDAIDVQTSSIHELIASIDKLASSIDAMELYGNQISSVFSDFLVMAKSGEQSSAKLDETNQKITASSNEILSVITIIEEFFDKIKMLSLNATIEAARAGEYGRGFAVVANEIGKLSDDSAKELTQISDLIEKKQERC